MHAIEIFVCCLLIAGALSSTGLADDASEKGIPGKQVERSFQTSDGTSVPYLLYLPADYADDAEGGFGMILFLHGRGESEGPLQRVSTWGPPRFAARGDALPWIIVSPQCPTDDWWSSDTQLTRLSELLVEAKATYNVNSSRVFLTGLSMGGFGSWALAARHPDQFAAVAPICGGGDPSTSDKLKDIPIWAFHGDQDKAVPLAKSKDMVDGILNAGGSQVRLTVLEHVGHNSWSAAYATPQLYAWMEQQAQQ